MTHNEIYWSAYWSDMLTFVLCIFFLHILKMRISISTQILHTHTKRNVITWLSPQFEMSCGGGAATEMVKFIKRKSFNAKQKHGLDIKQKLHKTGTKRDQQYSTIRPAEENQWNMKMKTTFACAIFHSQQTTENNNQLKKHFCLPLQFANQPCKWATN